ncbi:MAG: HypC/HybG/HupF family hydrogenase formation chaperone [Dehalococcoidales bacterium]
MCLAIPARINTINGTEAEVKIGGITRKASLMLTPDARVGDYVLLHTGYAINIINQIEAEQTLALFAEIAKLTELE